VKVIQNYTLTLNFVKKKNHRHFKNILIYKANQIKMTKKNSKKILDIFEDGASGVQVGDIEQVILFIICLKYDQIPLN
jgi:hypothetical protein